MTTHRLLSALFLASGFTSEVVLLESFIGGRSSNSELWTIGSEGLSRTGLLGLRLASVFSFSASIRDRFCASGSSSGTFLGFPESTEQPRCTWTWTLRVLDLSLDVEVWRADFFDFWLEFELDPFEQIGHESMLSLSDEQEVGPLQTCDDSDSDRERRFLFEIGSLGKSECRIFLSSRSEMDPDTDPVQLPDPRPESDLLPTLLLATRLTLGFFDLLFEMFECRSYFFELSLDFDFDSRLVRLLVLVGRTFRYFRRCFRWVELSRCGRSSSDCRDDPAPILPSIQWPHYLILDSTQSFFVNCGKNRWELGFIFIIGPFTETKLYLLTQKVLFFGD